MDEIIEKGSPPGGFSFSFMDYKDSGLSRYQIAKDLHERTGLKSIDCISIVDGWLVRKLIGKFKTCPNCNGDGRIKDE